MRKNNFLVAIAIIVFLVVIGYVGVSFYLEWKRDADGAQTGAPTQTEAPTESEPPETEPMPTYDYVTEIKEEVLMTELDKQYLMLVNKQHPLESDYEPEQTTFFRKKDGLVTKDEELEARTAEALLMMMTEMRACGIRDTLVTSAYRSYARQEELFRAYIEKEIGSAGMFSDEAYACLGKEYIREHYSNQGKLQLSHEDAKRVVMSYSAEPGTSEHQSGLCVDFITEDMNGHLTTAFEEKEAFAWLSENAHKFGFILRYPEGKEAITGYTYEPWHYRFVGREAATEIHQRKITLEEYLSATPS